MGFPLVDVHAHIVFPHWTVEEHLSFMDAEHIRKSYLSSAPPHPGAIDASRTSTVSRPDRVAERVLYLRQCNGYGVGLRKQYPERFGYLATLPLDSIEDTLREIEHCTTQLKVDGFIIYTNHTSSPGGSTGVSLNDPVLERVWERFEQSQAVVFVHPSLPCAAPAHHRCFSGDNTFNPQRDDVQRARRLSGGASSSREQQQQHNVTNKEAGLLSASDASISSVRMMLDFAFESTRCASDLLLSGVPQRYRRIRWILPDCGAALPSVLDRIIDLAPQLTVSPAPSVPSSDLSMTTLPPRTSTEQHPHTEPVTLTREMVREVCNNQIWFDVGGSSARSQIEYMLRWVDHSRFLYGSNFPFTLGYLSNTESDLTVTAADRGSTISSGNGRGSRGINTSSDDGRGSRGNDNYSSSRRARRGGAGAGAGAIADTLTDMLHEIFGGETGVHEVMCVSYGNADELFGST